MTSIPSPLNFSPGKASILRLPEVLSRVGLCRASVYKQMAAGSFPRPIAIGVRARGWLESEVDTWIALRVRDRETNLS